MADEILGEALTATEYKAAYDAEAKRLLANKIVLARILKECVDEYKDCSLEDIEMYIEGEPHIGDIPVHRYSPDRNVSGMNTEDKTNTEGTQFFDIRFYAALPNSNERIGLIINVEAQNNFDPGYALVRRGIYYCCRMLSAQHGETFIGEHYENLKKVYSILVFPHAPVKYSDTITTYRIIEEYTKGRYIEKPDNYDLLQVVLVNFNDDDTSEGINRFLKVLLSNTFSGKEKHQILTDEFHITLTDELERGIDSMCNLSTGIEEKGIKKGRTQERFELIRNMFFDLHLPVESIAKVAKTTVEEVKKILAEKESE